MRRIERVTPPDGKEKPKFQPPPEFADLPKVKFVSEASVKEPPPPLVVEPEQELVGTGRNHPAGGAGGFEPVNYVIPKKPKKEYKQLPFFVGNCLVIGSTGSGKSVAITNILLHVDKPSRVYMIVKTAEFDDEIDYMSVLNQRKINYEMVDIENLEALISRLEEDKKEEIHPEKGSGKETLTSEVKKGKKPGKEALPLLIFDDVGNDLAHNPDFLNFIKHSRKVTSGVIVSIQSHEQIPPGVYKNMKRFLLFSNLPEKEIDTILEKMPTDIPSSEIKKAWRQNKEKYNFIVVDMLNSIITNKFDRVIYRA